MNDPTKKDIKCLKVEKRNGEKIRQLLVKFGYLDNDHRIESDETHIFFPLRRHVELEGIFTELDTRNLEVVVHSVRSRSRRMSYRDMLENILPEELYHLIPSSFDLIGQIAIVKVLPEVIGYKEEIGKSIISSTNARTVYLKTGNVSGNFRLPELEFIAGEPLEETTHNEHGLKLFIDVKKAFFNPRLANEHQRVANLVRSGETVVDFFTGTGPFALLIAKRVSRSKVYAIDINPDAIRCLNESLKLNKLQGTINPIIGDIKNISDLLPEADRAIMNLPGQASEFLNIAFEKTKKGGAIHYYSFSPKNATDPVKAVCEEIEIWFEKHGLPGKIKNAFKLREVSVAKFQVAVDILRS
ncbi:MAG: class I SAM-dependent methyltransferase family protein [Candidatus Odinarchaeota archaeon]